MIEAMWNVRGLNKLGRLECLKDFIHNYNLDFVGLQETMKKQYTDKFFRQTDPNRDFEWNWIPSNGKSGGVLCGLRKERLELKRFVVGDFSILAHVWDRKLKQNLSLAIIYGPAQEEKKESFCY